MQTRDVTYTAHPMRADAAEGLHILEARSVDGLHHAVAVPTDWHAIDPPVDPDPDAPVLGALHVETLDGGPDSGVVVAGHLVQGRLPDARSVASWLAGRDGFAPYRWNDEDDDAGGARVMASTATHTMAIRVLPHGDLWAFVAGVVPKARLDRIGGVLQAAVVTFRLPPEWTRDA